MKSHHVLVIPGLNDHLQYSKYVWATNVFWRKQGVVPHVVWMDWMIDQKPFNHRLKKLVSLIDSLSRENTLSLVGFSAGASAAINAFYERKKVVHRVVSVCGRLRVGEGVTPTLIWASKFSKPFAESVRLCQIQQMKLTPQDLKKVLCLRAWFDELVPESTSFLPGASNKTLPMVEHLLTGAAAATVFSKIIIDFIKS